MNKPTTRPWLAIPGRLFLKIFLSLWLAIMLVGMAVDFAVNARFQLELEESPDLSVGYRAELATQLVATHLQRDGIADARRLFQEWSGRRPLPVLVVAEETSRDILDRPVPLPALEQARRLIAHSQGGSAVQQIAAPDGSSYFLFVPLALQPASPPSQHVYLAPDSRQIELVTMTLASLLFAFGLAWYLYRPIRHLHEGSQRFATGALDTRIAPKLGARSDEIADLAHDFDDMAEHLQSTIVGKTRLLHDVSHELRSPLTRIQIAIGIAHQSADKMPRMLDRIKQEITRLDGLLEETLTLARLETKLVSPKEQDCVNLVELLEDVAADARFEASQQGNTVELRASGTILVASRGTLLRSAIENVVRNALLHTPPGTRVTIDLAPPQGQHVSLRICDSGPGVAAHELATIFEPFYRGSSAEQRNGYGLGLSIARRAIEAHGGKIRADNLPTGGLCVVFTLPIAQIEPAAGQEGN